MSAAFVATNGGVAMATSKRLLPLAGAIGLLVLGCEKDRSDPGPPPPPARHAISGRVAGTVSAGVTVALGGAATRTTTTDAAGTFTFTDLADGAYTVTPSRSGHGFDPPVREVRVSGADAVEQDFAAGVGYAIGGVVSGAWAEGVTVTLQGPAARTTTTNAAGEYTFVDLLPGSYVVTPALAGYDFVPSASPVTITSADQAQAFAATPTGGAYSISGTVTYAGTKMGRVYLSARKAERECPRCPPRAGTSIAAPGAFTIRGLPPGRWEIDAWMDDLATGVRNVANPDGWYAADVSGDLSGVSIALADRNPMPPPTPSGLSAFPGNGSAMLSWNMDVASPRRDREVDAVRAMATSYRISWGTDAAATNGGSVTVPARDDPLAFVTGLTDGAAYYFSVRSRVGTSESEPSAPVGPVTIGAAGGGHTLGGTVTFPASVGGQLFVGAYDRDRTVRQFVRIASPSSPQPYAISGLPSGSYVAFAVLDANGNGAVDGDDLSTTAEEHALGTVSGDTSHSLALSGAGARPWSATTHGCGGCVGGGWYSLELQVSRNAKRPVAVTLYSGRSVPVPLDVGLGDDFEASVSLGTARPEAGDVYRFKVVYSDGTTELLSTAVTGVLDAFAQGLWLDWSTPSASLLNWSDPSSPPESYTYFVQLAGYGSCWWYPDGVIGMPSTQHSVVYDVDGTASPCNSPPEYRWTVSVVDSNGNRAQSTAVLMID